MHSNTDKAIGLRKPRDVVFRSPETIERSFEVRARPRAQQFAVIRGLIPSTAPEPPSLPSRPADRPLAPLLQ